MRNNPDALVEVQIKFCPQCGGSLTAYKKARLTDYIDPSHVCEKCKIIWSNFT